MLSSMMRSHRRTPAPVGAMTHLPRVLAGAALIMLLSMGTTLASSGVTVIRGGEVSPGVEPQGRSHSAVESGNILAAGTPYATRYVVRESGLPGPTVMIIGGMHGNETAGYMAARRLMSRTPARGRLVVIPEANQLGVRAGARTGGHPGDLNRDFPRSRSDQPDSRLAKDLWALVKSERPDYLLDLHEGYDFHRTNPQSVGQSIIYYPTDEAYTAAKAMRNAVNRTIAEPDHRFSLIKYPIQGSLARAAGRNLGVKAMIVETSRRQPLETRIEQHILMVEALLERLRM